MSCSFKLKVIAIEQRKSVKEFFFRSAVRNSFSTNYKLTVGVDILTADCHYNEHEFATLSIWDIGNQMRFHFIRNTFYRGAAGGLIFTPYDYDSLISLEPLILEIRTYSGDIPLYLVGKICEELNEFDIETIESFIEHHNLNGYFILPDQINFVLDELTNEIISNRNDVAARISFKKLDSAKKVKYSKFMDYFTTCPICLRSLHKNYLWCFLTSVDRQKIELKNRVLLLIDESEKFDDIYFNQIKVGIPCCECFKKFFR